MRLSARIDRFVSNKDQKLLKHPVYANNEEIGRKTRSSSGAFQRKRRLSENEELPAKRCKVDTDKESFGRNKVDRGSLEDRFNKIDRLKEEYLTTNKYKLSTELPFIKIKKVTPPDSSYGFENSKPCSTKVATPEPRSLALSSDLKRKSRNSINALLDAELFKPEVVPKKGVPVTNDEDGSDEDDDDDDDDSILCNKWVGKKTANQDNLGKVKYDISNIKSDNSDDEDEKPLKSRTKYVSFNKSNPVEGLDYESVLRNNIKKNNVETSSTISTRIRSGAVQRRSYVDMKDVGNSREGGTAGRSNRSKSVIGIPASQSGSNLAKAHINRERFINNLSADSNKLTRISKEVKSASTPQEMVKKERVHQSTRETEPAKFINKQNQTNKALTEKANPSVKLTEVTKDGSTKSGKAPVIDPGSNQPPGGVRYSNNMAEAVQVRCCLCGQKVTMTGMRSHTRSAHKMPISEYKAKFGILKDKILETVYHQCGLCHKDVLLDSDEIMMHLKRSHKISHKKLNEIYETAFRPESTNEIERN